MVTIKNYNSFRVIGCSFIIVVQKSKLVYKKISLVIQVNFDLYNLLLNCIFYIFTEHL